MRVSFSDLMLPNEIGKQELLSEVRAAVGTHTTLSVDNRLWLLISNLAIGLFQDSEGFVQSVFVERHKSKVVVPLHFSSKGIHVDESRSFSKFSNSTVEFCLYKIARQI